ncbi:MAG: nucleotidyltransferase domain-containing protein [Tissierellaceae bacterium]
MAVKIQELHKKYGPYARGTNIENSDIDIVVIVNEVEGSFLEKGKNKRKLK